jgi:copper homeostasis protein (lipoprotein)
MIKFFLRLVALLAITGLAALPGHAASTFINGKVSFSESVKIPAGAKLVVILEQTESTGDAPQEISRITLRIKPAPAYAFRLTVDKSKILKGAERRIIARIIQGNAILASTVEPVKLPVILKKPLKVVLAPSAATGLPPVQATPLKSIATVTPPTPATPALYDTLPASFKGVLPCADCPGIKVALNLLPDGIYLIEREYQGKPVPNVFPAIGKWSSNADKTVLTLTGDRFATLKLKIISDSSLEVLDGGPPHTLERDASYQPMGNRFKLSGLLTYQQSRPVFTECVSEHRFNITPGGDLGALEKSYKKQPASTGPVLAVFDGRAIRTGKQKTVEIEVMRFVSLRPGADCKSPETPTALTGTRWKLTELTGQILPPFSLQYEPALEFSPDNKLSGADGCNRIMGSYTLNGESLTIPPLAGTRAACPRTQRFGLAFHATLKKVARWQVSGNYLDLFDASGLLLARLQPASVNREDPVRLFSR